MGSEQKDTVGIRLSDEKTEEYLKSLEAAGRTPGTLECYRRHLGRLCDFTGKDRRVDEKTLPAWRDHMLRSGYSAKTVNIHMAAANGLMRYLGYWEFQAERLPEEEYIQSELTRAEYLRLLSAAKLQGRERKYLLVKLFATTGISVSDIKYLTAEAVLAGRVALSDAAYRIPGGLKNELLHYLKAEGIASGPVFRTRDGRPQDRTTVNAMIKSLCRDAQVSEEKANPRCLRNLYLATQAGIRENFALLVEQAYDRILEKEQNIIGWEHTA